MAEEKYHVYIELSQGGGDLFGLSLWKDDVIAVFWGTLQELHDLGENIIKEVKETQEMCEKVGEKFIVVSKEQTSQVTHERRITK